MKFRKYLTELTAELGVGIENKPIVRYFLPNNAKPHRFEELPEGLSKKVYKKFLEILKTKDPLTFKMLTSGKYDPSEMDITIRGDKIIVKMEDGGEKSYNIPEV